MAQILFRIIELRSGSIEIDGIDISTLGLRDLRQRLAMIPQDPLLFNVRDGLCFLKSWSLTGWMVV
jgi:ABC-type multidrug transport system fused ATPase/permease subunit